MRARRQYLLRNIAGNILGSFDTCNQAIARAEELAERKLVWHQDTFRIGSLVTDSTMVYYEVQPVMWQEASGE